MDQNYEEKIRELEEQIRQLNEQLSKLIGEKNKTPTEKRTEFIGNHTPTRSLDKPEHQKNLTPDSERVREVLREIKNSVGKNLEKKIGVEWATRISAVLVMTTFVLISRATFFSEIFNPVSKVLFIYGFSLLFLFVGLLSKKRSILTDSIVSCGLAGIPYATYALFFLEGTQFTSISPDNTFLLLFGLGIILITELPLILVSHKRESATIAGIGLFLNYYTVALSCYGTPDLPHLTYALVTSLFIALVTFIFHILHKWFFLSWGGVISSYLTYTYVFIYLNPNTYLKIPDKPYFWISFAFLTASFIIFSTTCIIEAKRKNEYRKGIAPLVGLNSFIYFALSFYLIRVNYLEYEYIFRSIFTLFLLTFAILANLIGERYNYIFKIFAIKTFIMATLALQAYFSGEKLLVALSIECLALFLAYKRSGYEIYKWMNLFLLIFTFLWGVAYFNVSGIIRIFQYKIPIKWFSIVTSAIVLNLVGVLYEHFGDKDLYAILDIARRNSIPSFYLAILHACSASLLILLITLSSFIGDIRLPYILMFQFLLVFGFGYMTLTRALEFCSALLLVSSQITFLVGYFYFKYPLADNNYITTLSFLLAFISFLGSYVAERFFTSITHSQNDILHFIPTLFFYSISILILTTVLLNTLPPSIFLSFLALSGIGLFYLGYVNKFRGMCLSGYCLTTISAFTLMYLSSQLERSALSWEFVAPIILTSLSLILAERTIYLMTVKSEVKEKVGKALRVGFVIILLSTLMFYGYASFPRELLIFYWLFVGIVLILIGIFIQESLYRWASFFAILITILRVFFVFNYISSEIYRILNFAFSALVLLAIGWIYTKTEDVKKDE